MKPPRRLAPLTKQEDYMSKINFIPQPAEGQGCGKLHEKIPKITIDINEN